MCPVTILKNKNINNSSKFIIKADEIKKIKVKLMKPDKM